MKKIKFRFPKSGKASGAIQELFKKVIKDPIKLDIINIAWPVLMELVLSSVFGMIDMMMLGNISNHEYAAIAVSSVGLTNQPLLTRLKQLYKPPSVRYH